MTVHGALLLALGLAADMTQRSNARCLDIALSLTSTLVNRDRVLRDATPNQARSFVEPSTLRATIVPRSYRGTCRSSRDGTRLRRLQIFKVAILIGNGRRERRPRRENSGQSGSVICARFHWSTVFGYLRIDVPPHKSQRNPPRGCGVS